MSSKNPQADFDQALDLKIKGNECFKSGDLKGALKNYSRIFMHIGMNPCMNMSQMMGQAGTPNPATPQQKKDPLQQKTDELRLTAFNNMAAVYAKMNKWDDCKEKCSRVLKVDDKNTKALFRRGMAQRKLNLYELARVDLQKAKGILTDKKDAAIERELKLLNRDEKNADKAFYAKMKKQMQKAKRIKKQKQQLKNDQKKKLKEEEMKKDDNPNIAVNKKVDDEDCEEEEDDAFMWDIPQDKDSGNAKAKDVDKVSENDDANVDKGNIEDNESNVIVEDTINDKSTEQPSEF